RQDIAYVFAPRAPILLGREGEYHFDRLRSNRYVQLHGSPTTRGFYCLEKREACVLVGFHGTPIVVRRRTLPGERWEPGQTPPQPDQRPFSVGGRLLAQEDAERYREAFEK